MCITEADHTPGPWYVTGSDPNGGMVFAADNTPVAAWPSHDDSSLQMANAKLIAAAPALLKALKWALPLLLTSLSPTWETQEARQRFAKELLAAQAAIEAAER